MTEYILLAAMAAIVIGLVLRRKAQRSGENSAGIEFGGGGGDGGGD